MIISYTLTTEAGRNISSILRPIKHNIHGDISGIIWVIRNDLISDDCCFPHKESAELVRQEFSRVKIWKIYISVIFPQVPS